MHGRYRLIAPVLALVAVDLHYEAATVPTGTVVDLDGKTFNGSRLMDVLWNGRMVMIFTDELKVSAVPWESDVSVP